jgi:hypothetical protein
VTVINAVFAGLEEIKNKCRNTTVNLGSGTFEAYISTREANLSNNISKLSCEEEHCHLTKQY